MFTCLSMILMSLASSLDDLIPYNFLDNYENQMINDHSFREVEFPSRDKYMIGLTGGIASGKSNIAKYLRELPDFEVQYFDQYQIVQSCSSTSSRSLPSYSYQLTRSNPYQLTQHRLLTLTFTIEQVMIIQCDYFR